MNLPRGHGGLRAQDVPKTSTKVLSARSSSESSRMFFNYAPGCVVAHIRIFVIAVLIDFAGVAVDDERSTAPIFDGAA